MTVIAALFSDKGIAVASDSMLAAIAPSGGHVYLEWQQSKIVSIPKLSACISYWGLAGQLRKIPNHREQPQWLWQTYDWLQKQSANPKYQDLEDFSKDIRDKLDAQLNSMRFDKNIDKGIGLHIAGFEKIDDYMIPELFLICNYTDPSYERVGQLGLSRNTYKTIAKCEPSIDHGKKEFRYAVKDHLRKGNLLSYNNGDPIMFNMVSSTIFAGFRVAADRRRLRRVNFVQDTVPIVKRPVEIISEIQKDFFEAGKRMVGGKIHDLAIDNRGNLYSTSGDM